MSKKTVMEVIPKLKLPMWKKQLGEMPLIFHDSNIKVSSFLVSQFNLGNILHLSMPSAATSVESIKFKKSVTEPPRDHS